MQKTTGNYEVSMIKNGFIRYSAKHIFGLKDHYLGRMLPRLGHIRLKLEPLFSKNL